MKYALFILSLLILPMIVFAQDTGFVPLTRIPLLTETVNQFNLSDFLNNLYRLAIGVAAVIAVLQIMRAGIIYMGGDSVTEKKEAKNLIALSIGGLILVLSPVIVFSIINPEILSLKINNLSDLAARQQQLTTVVLQLNSAEDCENRNGTPEDNPDTPTFECRVPLTSSDGTGFTQQCSQFENIQAIPSGFTCRSLDSESPGGFVSIATACCDDVSEGGMCCGSYIDVTQGGEVNINTDIAYEIYQEWNATENEGQVRGVVPRDDVRVDSYVAACTEAGGTMEYGREGNWWQQFTTAAWGQCDHAATQVPESTGNPATVYQCQDRRSSCVLPAP